MSKLELVVNLIEFCKGVFNHDPGSNDPQMVFCGFREDPNINNNWDPRTLDKGKMPKDINKSHNCYFNVATFWPEKGEYRALGKNIAGHYAIVLDDVGTKVKKKLKKLKLSPSWVTETSPGNYQVGFILETPCMNLDLYVAVLTALANASWTDAGAAGAGRWFRMPFGVNTKKKYKTDDGAAPRVRLKTWNPERRYSIEQIVKAFKLKLFSGEVCSSSIDNEKSDDPVLLAIKNAGLLKGQLKPGQHDITCPWVNSHTDEKDHGSAYYEPSTENKQAGGFKCQHGHCVGRNIINLKEYLGIPKQSQENSTIDGALLAVKEGLYVFHDENGEPFGFFNGNCWQLMSKKVVAHVLKLSQSATGKTYKTSNVHEMLATLESESLIEGNEHQLFNRVAYYKKSICYDLGNGKITRIGPKDWKTVEAPVLFRRYHHHKEQLAPATDGDPWQVFVFFNIAEAHQLLTLVLLISYLIPDIPHPIFHPHGAHGSGKSTLCMMIKDLIDPSNLTSVFASKNKSEHIRQISRHHILIFDNVSKIDSEMSDILCMACTGGGMSKRALYTNDDDIIYNFKNCIGLNGINLLITKPDLLDRTILLHLKRISKKKRKEETEIWRHFEKAKTEILGGMFSVLVKAMAIHPTVKLKRLPRMADFATWGYAIAEALEEGLGKQFLRDYESNVKLQHAEVLQNNSLCLAVKLLMESTDYWEDTVKSTYEELSRIINPSKVDNTFPADAKNMRNHLERIQTTLLEAENIKYRYSEKAKSDGYHIEFIRTK